MLVPALWLRANRLGPGVGALLPEGPSGISAPFIPPRGHLLSSVARGTGPVVSIWVCWAARGPRVEEPSQSQGEEAGWGPRFPHPGG